MWDVWGPDALASVQPVPAERAWVGDDPLVARFPFQFSSLSRYVVVGDAPDLPVAKPAAVQAVRIEVGEPVVGVDLDERTIPQEMGDVAAAVDFTKGCYLGQELVARIDSRGHVNRRLAGLIFSGTEVPPAGAEVSLAGSPVGSITSTAWSEALWAPIALGMIRAAVDPGIEVHAGSLRGVVSGLPFEV